MAMSATNNYVIGSRTFFFYFVALFVLCRLASMKYPIGIIEPIKLFQELWNGRNDAWRKEEKCVIVERVNITDIQYSL